VEVRVDLSTREVAILGFLAVVATAVFLFVLQPMAKERVRLTAEATKLAYEARKIEQTLRAVPRGQKGLEEARRRLEEIRATLLPNLSSLFSEISRPSKRLGVRIVSFTPQDPDPTQYGQVSADLVLEGTYLELGQYLEELFNGRYILTIDNLKMTAEDPGDERLRMRVILKSWVRQEAAG
jgi:Tfp pilus assembly protein PilO